MIRALLSTVALAATTLGAAPAALDSQAVLARYEHAVANAKVPNASIFSYAVSQAGAGDLEERHRLYRSGTNVRDETIARNGSTLHPKRVTITSRVDRYAVTRLAPRAAAYHFVFVRSVKDASHVTYLYETAPLAASDTFEVTRVAIDGRTFLPVTIEFRTNGVSAKGIGSVQYAAAQGYWMPLAASVNATVNGKTARERINFEDYAFPQSLPPATFHTPRPLPTATPPAL